MRPGLRRGGQPALIVLLLAFGAAFAATEPAASWLRVDYSELVDRRQLSHSGESVGELLRRLDGRQFPTAGQRPADLRGHRLLDPLLEPYAFVLPDALDAQGPLHERPFVEVGSLWSPGERQPAWVELLRARRYVVESDGTGRLRLCLPWSGEPQAETDSLQAARRAWDQAWPILRHVFAAERLRLAGRGGEAPTLEVEVRAYRHLPARSTFELGNGVLRRSVEDTRPDGKRPPLRLGGIERLFDGSLLLEGARIDAEGSLRLLGSPAARPPSMLGQPLSVADLAVAYRAVFHGGRAEPYMSLDRGYAPQRSIVNYGARLRDTSLGLVSLLCDIRFKTFSVGLDIVLGRDLRETVRAELPEFRSHLERFAAHPDSTSLAGQQTRLWFYPDDVDLTLSPQADVLVLRRVRMSAASERLQATGLGQAAAEQRPWTRAAVDAINHDYDALARFFPEMADLDQVVRLLSLFAWLDQLRADGRLLPELDSLLALELPQRVTPRSYPQLLAFNALPPPDSEIAVDAFDRVAVAEALDRLDPLGGRPFDARRRYQRAVAALDPKRREHAALLEELATHDVASLDDDRMDLLSHRAERIRMHQLVLATLEADRARPLAQRLEAGEQLRIFSVGIGGLDLDMRQAVSRARQRRADDPAPEAAGVGLPDEPREAWRRESAALPRAPLPDHGLAGPSPASTFHRFVTDHRVEIGTEGGSRFILTVDGADGPEVRSRKLLIDRQGRVESIERVERPRLMRYRMEPSPGGFVARLDEAPQAAATPPRAADSMPRGLVTLRLEPPPGGPLESAAITVRLGFGANGGARSLEAELPRGLLQRLVLGRAVDTTPNRPLGGLAPLPPSLGDVESMMVVPPASSWQTPWEGASPLLAGEEDPVRVARALAGWWASEGARAPAAVVGVDILRSPERWRTAPRPGPGALLLLPADAFGPPRGDLRRRLAGSWSAAHVFDTLPGSIEAPMVVLVSAEAPALFGRRLRELAGDPRLEGRYLAAWSLAGPIRRDLAGSLLAGGDLAGLGLASASVVAERSAVESIAELAQALDAGPGRVERLPGPFLWYF